MKNKKDVLKSLLVSVFATLVGAIVMMLLDKLWSPDCACERSLWFYVWMFCMYFILFYYLLRKGYKKKK